MLLFEPPDEEKKDQKSTLHGESVEGDFHSNLPDLFLRGDQTEGISDL